MDGQVFLVCILNHSSDVGPYPLVEQHSREALCMGL